MKEFDDLQKEWSNIKSETTYSEQKTESLMEKLKKIQKKIVFSNLFMSISFAVTFVVFGWIWTTFPDEEDIFYLSISGVAILLILTLGIQWYRVIFWKTPSSIAENLKDFSSTALKKLKFNLWVSNIFMPIYMLILASLLYLYFDYLLIDASLTFKFWAYFLTFTWVLGFGSFSIKRKWKKNKEELDPLINELQEIQNMFLNEENVE